MPFNKGFYSVDMTFYFLVKLDAIVSPLTPAVKVEGISVFQKKVILYGSEGSVNQFSSNKLCLMNRSDGTCDENMPTANLSVVNPICLACKLCDAPDCREVAFSCPEVVSKLFDDEFDVVRPAKVVCISIGLFSIVQLERTVQMMVPVYDFCIPDKEGCAAISQRMPAVRRSRNHTAPQRGEPSVCVPAFTMHAYMGKGESGRSPPALV